jgi:hypothetical protein
LTSTHQNNSKIQINNLKQKKFKIFLKRGSTALPKTPKKKGERDTIKGENY